MEDTKYQKEEAMTISSQSLSGDELTRFLAMLQKAQSAGTEDELNKELSKIVKEVIASRADRDQIKAAIAAKVKQKFPDITGV